MDKIESLPGKLLYIVYSMFKDNTISERDRGILKGSFVKI